MKIRPNSSSDNAIDIIQLEKQNASVKAKSDADAQKKLLDLIAADDNDDGDKVQVSRLASSLNGEFNPAQFLSERQAKIDKLKSQIESGTYKPSSENVAKALAEEIAAEILSSGGLLQAEN